MLNWILMICLATIPNAKDFEVRLEEARRDYDQAAANAVVTELQSLVAAAPSPEDRFLLARALLLAGELERLRFEETRAQTDRGKRREIGKRIDELADGVIAHAAALGETSEAYRLRSDALALKIRTKYQGSKYHTEMEECAAKALELDPKNARAYVSVCRPYLFAKPNQGGDLDKAFDLLTQAVALDPEIETAQFFLAIAYEKKGDSAESERVLKAILDKNPNCKLAIETFRKAEEAVEQEEEGSEPPSEKAP